ncbi:thioredoxin [Nocardiopsis trehalosi]|jgi:thioredoxin 1|uniref:thioredoxin n=1 Tax=Nocardiopsis trehalosi TaxID=109329 RepID=UPI00083734BA|nr:thioredoxin [Nocardiopsis trehalosi]
MPATAHLDEVTDADFAATVLDSPLPVLVDFTAEWCPPCRMVAPILADLAAERAGTLRVVAVDVDRSPRTAAAYNVLSAPTLMVFRDGEPVASVVGARSRSRLVRDLGL